MPITLRPFPCPAALALALAFLGPAAARAQVPGPSGLPAARFPAPVRPVAPIVSDRWTEEDARERVGEADQVMELMRIRPGQVVADIGAGAGYYAVRLARRVSPGGEVIAEDIVPEYLDGLRARLRRDGVANVVPTLGEPHDPRLPRGGVDAVVLIHMYHEIQQPFALLSNLVPALRPGAAVGIVDVDGPTERHGTPQALLRCELASVGYREVSWHWLRERPVYLAVFAPPAQPVAPERITPCPARR